MAQASTPVVRRIDWRLVIGAALVVLGVAGTLLVIGAMDETKPYLVVVRDIVDGETLTPEDIGAVEVHVRAGDFPYLGAQHRDLVAGSVAAQPLVAGELIPPQALSSPQARDTTTITLPLHINGAPWLRPGVPVDVWMSPSVEQGLFGPPRVVASGAVVSALRGEEGFAADPSGVSVDIRVIRRDAPAIIGALANNFPVTLTPIYAGAGQ